MTTCSISFYFVVLQQSDSHMACHVPEWQGAVQVRGGFYWDTTGWLTSHSGDYCIQDILFLSPPELLGNEIFIIVQSVLPSFMNLLQPLSVCSFHKTVREVKRGESRSEVGEKCSLYWSRIQMKSSLDLLMWDLFWLWGNSTDFCLHNIPHMFRMEEGWITDFFFLLKIFFFLSFAK